MFNPNAPNPRRPSHSLNTPVPILIDSDEEISDAENESESGSENDSMQVDEYPEHQTRDMGGYNLAGLDPTMQFSPADPRLRGHRQHHHPHHPHHHQTYHTSIEQEKKVRSRLREERHAALCVLMDRELLTIQALAAQETLPQARRRFLSKLMAPEDADIATSIRADRFTIQHPALATSSSSQRRHRPSSPSASASASASQPFVTSQTGPITVHRKIVDAYGVDDDGWKRPPDVVRPGSGFGSGSGSRSGGRNSSGSASPAPSSSAASLRRENANATPSKGRGAGSASASVSGSASRRLQRERERELQRRLGGRTGAGVDDFDHGDEDGGF